VNKIKINKILLFTGIIILCVPSLVFGQEVEFIIEDNKVTIDIPPISEGVEYIIELPSQVDISINKLSLGVAENVDENNIIIEMLENKPMSLNDVNGTVYKYISIDPGTITSDDISYVKIEFGVPKNWISENNVEVQKVGLLGIFEGEWSILSTEEKEDNSDEIIFISEISDLSFLNYAIAGNIPVVITTTTTTTTSTSTLTNGTTTVTTIPTTTVTESRVVQGDDTLTYIAIGVAVVAVVILIVIMRSSKKEVKQDNINEDQL
jgi:PGF-pre-PGF domain-containing protein